MSKTIERTVNALLKARRDLQDTLDNPAQGDPRFPWREYEQDAEVDPSFLRDVLADLDQQIIAIERAAYRDPEQDAEMRAEMYAEMAITGVRDDPSLYMHTPHEERLFQERIAHEVNYGYDDPEDGWVDGIYGDAPNVSACPTCGRKSVWWEDEGFTVAGYDCCGDCAEEAIAFMQFLAFVTNTGISHNKWETDFYFEEENDD